MVNSRTVTGQVNFRQRMPDTILEEYSRPQPVYNRTQHVYNRSESESVYRQTEPEPACNRSEPEPMYNQTEPVYSRSEPEPVYNRTEPEPMTGQTEPVYHRCLFCSACLPQGEQYINHVKDHLDEYRSKNTDPPDTKTRSRVRRLTKKRKKKKVSAERSPAAGEAERLSPLAAEGGRYSDDCMGDSELSDSDNEDELREQQEKERKEMKTLIARTRLSLAEKQLDTGEAEDLVCLTCLKKFSNIQNLRRHLRLHIARDSHIPDVDSDTENNNKLKFSCDFCPEKFGNKSAYIVHEKTHGDKQPECYVCGKKYADRYSLRYHLRTHGIGHQIRCELCNKSFPKPSRLQAHINAFHKNIRNFSCNHCDKSFKTRLHLENHELVHTGERPHSCAQCGEQFRHKVSLVAHLRIHADVRPYVCDTCGKSFREPSTMKAHMRVHSGVKPYKCDQCDKSFTQRAGLNYHKGVHVKPYRCDKCDYATAKPEALRSHQKSAHNIDLIRLKQSDSEVDSTISKSTDHTIQSLPLSSPLEDASLSSAPLLPGSLASPPLLPGSLPLPSPPLQEGDAVLRENSQDIYNNHHSNSLPSFNILKSYESTPPQGAIMSDAIKAGGGGGGGEDECGVSSERGSPYSQPSLSPPLTPPAHQEYYGHAYSFPPAAPLNYSTSYRECGGFLETGEYYQQRTKLEYCGLGRDQARDTYYDYNYYHNRHINNFQYQ